MGKKIFSVVKILFVSYAITALLLLAAAFLMYKVGIGENYMRILIMVIYGISTIVAGFLYGRVKARRRIVCGIAIGIIYFVILMCVSLIINHTLYGSASKAIISLVVCILGGIIGGMMS